MLHSAPASAPSISSSSHAAAPLRPLLPRRRGARGIAVSMGPAAPPRVAPEDGGRRLPALWTVGSRTVPIRWRESLAALRARLGEVQLPPPLPAAFVPLARLAPPLEGCVLVAAGAVAVMVLPLESSLSLEAWLVSLELSGGALGASAGAVLLTSSLLLASSPAAGAVSREGAAPGAGSVR